MASDDGSAGDHASAFLEGGGEMGRLMRAHDWAATPLGPVSGWPQSLKTVVQVLLNSRYPMFVWWGRGLTYFYNDAYAPTLGPKHPWALGRSAAVVWAEIWDTIGPLGEDVLYRGRSTWNENLLLFLERNGFPEETYHTFSYSPVANEQGGVGGVFCAVTETTPQVLGQRRTRALRELAAGTTGSRTAEDACRVASEILAANRPDLPFALIYLIDEDGQTARLAGSSGLAEASRARPAVVEIEGDGRVAGSPSWPLGAVLASGRAELVEGLGARFGPIGQGPWPEPAASALALPLRQSGQGRLAGFLIAGLSPRLVVDDDYRGFLDLLAGQIASAVANARAYEEERARSEALAELDRAKSTFFSNVSHEFRTPLTLLLGPVEELLTRADPDQREMLGLAHRNALRLQKLVNTLLDFSRIEAGRLRAVHEPTDLAAFTADLASNFRSACERAGLELKVDCPPLPGPVYLDRDMWEKVVLNLLSNAFKFTQKGRIEVGLRAAGARVELTVRDTGTGIPAAEVPRLFERFHRVEGATGRTQEGSGIGLALVRELARLHGGDVEARSAEGQGSVFTVTIPFGAGERAEERTGPPTATASTTGAAAYVEEALRWLPEGEPAPGGLGKSPQAGASENRPTVLLADDNADVRDYVRRLLAGHYEVTAVGDGLSALESARARPPDLVLTDVMMPGLDGFGLLRELRLDPATRGVPVLMLSARAGEEARVEGLASGADDYITKPFHSRELLARVDSQVALARLRRQAEQERRRGDERIRAILESITDAFFALDRDWKFSYLNPQAERVLNRRPGELLGKGLWDEYPGLEGSAFQRSYLRAMDEQVASSACAYYPDHDRWYEVHTYPSPEGLSVYFRDVTERARAEERERLLQAEAASANARFRAFFEQGALFAGIMDLDGTFLESNRLSLESTGFSREQVVGRKFWDCGWWDPATDAPRRVRDASARAASGETVRAELPYFQVDGSERLVDLTVLPITDDTGKVLFLAPTGTDVTDRKRAESDRHKFVSLVENSTDFIAMFDPGGVPFYVNQAGLELVGLDGIEEAARTPIGEFFFPEDRARIVEELIPSALERGHGESEVRFRHFRTGQGRWMIFNLFPLTDPEGRRIGLATVSRDITRRRELEDDLRQLAADLSEADRRKDEFLATLAHELRNPLAPIRNTLRILRLDQEGCAVDDESRELIERQVTHMVRLIDDLMDVSRITRGKLELRRETLELAEVVRSAVETSRPLVEAAGHELSLSLPDGPTPVDADATRLSQVFSNLLNNAARYTEPGGRIALEARRENGRVTVTVRDNGSGIPPEILPRIFEPFTQGDRSLERSQGGLGIGLTLVRRLVEMHGGSVEARSDGPGLGSEFVVRLPVLAEAPGRSIAPPLAETSAAPGLRILVVDDNRDSARTLARLLRLLGHRTLTAHDGGEAVEVAERERPDLILLDIGLPVLNGYDVARLIRSRPWGSAVSIVALTGWGQEGDRRRSVEAGIDHHLVKPVDPDALARLLTDSGP